MRVLLLLAAAVCGWAEPHRLVLLQELVRLEAMERRTIIMFPLEQQDAELELKFTSKLGGEGVRAAIFAQEDSAPMAASRYETAETMRVPLKRQRMYRVELENLRQRLGHAVVDVEAMLVFGARHGTAGEESVRTLEPRRRFYTILTSVGVFLVICGYAAARIGPPILERIRGER
jgi:hypothetical protein